MFGQSRKVHYERPPEDVAKFKQLLHTIIWAQAKTGKSSSEIVCSVLRKGKFTYETFQQ